MNVSAVRQPKYPSNREREYGDTVQMHLFVMHDTAKQDERNYGEVNSRAVGSDQNPKGDTHAYPVRHRDRSCRLIHRLVS